MVRLTTRATLLAAALIVAASSGSIAHDYWHLWTTKTWQRGDPGSTYQHWDFTISPGPTPTSSNNPYGVPFLGTQDAQYPDVVIGPDWQPIPTWHLGDLVVGNDGTLQPIPGSINVFIWNNPVGNPVKWIYVQITSDTAASGLPVVWPTPVSITSPGPIVQHQNPVWHTFNWLIEIQPNPPYERLTFAFPYSTNISQVVVDTICTIPEPSTLAGVGMPALLMAALTLRRLRR